MPAPAAVRPIPRQGRRLRGWSWVGSALLLPSYTCCPIQCVRVSAACGITCCSVFLCVDRNLICSALAGTLPPGQTTCVRRRWGEPVTPRLCIVFCCCLRWVLVIVAVLSQFSVPCRSFRPRQARRRHVDRLWRKTDVIAQHVWMLGVQQKCSEFRNNGIALLPTAHVALFAGQMLFSAPSVSYCFPNEARRF